MSKSTIIKKISYSVFANVISLLVSIFMVIIVPKFLSLEDYGLWQLFLFYYSYIGFFHFGWEDGIYLRYAGNSFETLDSKLFAGQLYGIIVLQLLVSAVVLTGSMWVCPNADCGFCLRQGAENSSLRPLVGNGRYKSRKKADETVIILEPYTILFRIRSGGRNFASNGCCLLPLTVFMIPVLC